MLIIKYMEMSDLSGYVKNFILILRQMFYMSKSVFMKFIMK